MSRKSSTSSLALDNFNPTGREYKKKDVQISTLFVTTVSRWKIDPIIDKWQLKPGAEVYTHKKYKVSKKTKIF
jgi:hypothetical protein